MDTSLRDCYQDLVGTGEWIILDPDDAKKFRQDITCILIQPQQHKIRIVWEENGKRSWEAFVEYLKNASPKKLICIAISNPVTRGTVTRDQFRAITENITDIESYSLIGLSKSSQVTRNLIDQEPKEPISPMDQS